MADAKGEAEIHLTKSKKLAAQKLWQEARDEAAAATVLDPANADAWLVLGTSEQRLDHEEEAIQAFRAYLDRKPPEDKAAAVRARVAELELGRDQRQKAAEEASRAQYGTSTPGFGFGYSPVLDVKLRSDAEALKSSISSSFDVQFGPGWFALGFRYGSGTTPSLIAHNETTSTTTKVMTVTDTLVTDAPHKFYEMYLSSAIPLNEPYGKLGLFQVFVPIVLGLPWNTVSAAGKSYSNMGLDLATGLGVRLYTKSFFSANLTGLYHFVSVASGLSSKDQKNTTAASYVNVLQTAHKANLRTEFAGFELRLGVTILISGGSGADGLVK